MSTYYLSQDEKKCIGCHSCEISCKANKNLPVGPRPCQVVEVGPKFINSLPKTSFVFMPCFHCENPWCVSACPTGAMQQRTKDGIVFVEKDLCVGCKACVGACPWGAPQWDDESKKVAKCDYCKDRIDQGLKPACVTTCTTGCLSFGKVEDAALLKRERHAASISTFDSASI